MRFAFGVQRGNDDNSKVEVDDKLLKQHMQRLFKCLIEKLPIPYDIVMALTAKASMPKSYNKKIVKDTFCSLCGHKKVL